MKRFICLALLNLFINFFSFPASTSPSWTERFLDEDHIINPFHLYPFKERLPLSSKIKKNIKLKYEKERYPFGDNDPNIEKIGAFLIDKGYKLGYGDTASVYLALHKNSNILVAAKVFYREVELEENGDFNSLQKLNRLFGCYTCDSRTAMFLPYAGGEQILSFLGEPSDFQERLNSRIKRANAFLQELSYLAARGVVQMDQQSAQFIFDSTNTNNILTVDFSSCYYKHPIFEHYNASAFIQEDKYPFTKLHAHCLDETFSNADADGDWKEFLLNQRLKLPETVTPGNLSQAKCNFNSLRVLLPEASGLMIMGGTT